ncbi:aldo/keto reductase [Corallococcus carmarthensis]|uniref:aldo/keto reductase n=1 Tax=Corallococcus carmarthensis TaxID=2316728 RepID=UPI0013153DAC|nr:aldo/keto reductase [Corallococcus carmarthensis]NOK18533.1 aldo/keto reductase [Corallococcus carmarthensis]
MSLGTSRLGHPELSLSTAQGVLESALEGGITYIDAAPHYGNAEAKLKPFLRSHRDKVLIASKVLADRPGRREVIAQLEQSLERTGAGYLDVVHVHSAGDLDFEQVFGRDGMLAGLEEARARGLLRYIGMSAHHRVAHVARIVATEAFDVVMLPLNIIDRHGYDFEEHVLPIAGRSGAAVLAMKVLGGAIPHAGPESTGQLASRSESALRYALGLPGIASAVIGCCNEEQVRAALEVARAYQPLPAPELEEILATGRKLAETLGQRWGPRE